MTLPEQSRPRNDGEPVYRALAPDDTDQDDPFLIAIPASVGSDCRYSGDLWGAGIVEAAIDATLTEFQCAPRILALPSFSAPDVPH